MKLAMANHRNLKLWKKYCFLGIPLINLSIFLTSKFIEIAEKIEYKLKLKMQ